MGENHMGSQLTRRYEDPSKVLQLIKELQPEHRAQLLEELKTDEELLRSKIPEHWMG